MDRDEKRRRQVQDEILSSERSYVDDLTTCVDLFMKPLLLLHEQPTADSTILSKQEIQIVFNNIEVIIALNCQLLSALELLSSASSSSSSVGQIFLDLAPYLKMYTVFVKHHSAASALHQRLLQENTKYAVFIDQQCGTIQHQDRLRNRTLADFLIMPVQRVPRYKLLLQELLNTYPATVEGGAEQRQVLESALAKVTAVARMVNESIQEHLDRMRVLHVQQRFSGQVHLVEPHRKFVLEAELVKHCRRGPKKYVFFLFTDVLVYAGMDESADAATAVLQFKRTLPLSTMEITWPVDGYDNAFQLSSPQKSFFVSAKSEEQRQEWVQAVSACIKRWKLQEEEDAAQAAVAAHSEASQQQQRKRTANLHNAAPVWVPDREAPACQTCEAKFTLFLRKHHCRHCGHVICADCSPHRFILPNLAMGNKPHRVCQECYVEMRDQVAAAGNTDELLTANRPAPPPVSSATGKRLSTRYVSRSSTTATTTALASSPARPATADEDDHTNTATGEEENDADLPQHWRVLVDEQNKKYYWSTSTDAITYTRPPTRMAEEEAAAVALNGQSGRRTQHMSQRFGFNKKRTSNAADETAGAVDAASLLLMASSEYASTNPLMAAHYYAPAASPIAAADAAPPSPPTSPMYGSSTNTRKDPSPSLADTLAHLADAGTFGDDASKLRFTTRRINALASLTRGNSAALSSSPKSTPTRKSRPGSARFTSVFRNSPQQQQQQADQLNEEEEEDGATEGEDATPPSSPATA